MFARDILLLFGMLVAKSFGTVVKCCENGYVFNEDMKCSLPGDVNVTLSEVFDLSNETNMMYITCLKDEKEKALARQNATSESTNSSFCIEVVLNGTTTSDICTNVSRRVEESCDSVFTPLKYWGATIVIVANMIYIFPYLIVVILYFCIPELRKRAYDGAVMSFCCTQVGICVILSIMAYFFLCHKPIAPISYVLFGLSLMFLTVSAMLWQFIICFDVALAITRFRWKQSNNTKARNKDRKFFVYSVWVWGGTALPTAFAGFVELSPFVPKSWIIRPHFDEFEGTNIAVIVYVITIPILVCVVNNIMFAYATYVIISVRQETKRTERSKHDTMMKKYFFFLRLYLLMDAPWLTGALSAIYSDLWLLKFVRMFHPIALLFAMLPRQTFLVMVQRIKNLF